MQNEQIEDDNLVGYIEQVGQMEEVPAGTTIVLPLDSVLEQQIMSFLKGSIGPRMLPVALLSLANPSTAVTSPKVSETTGNDDYFYPLLGSVKTDNDHDMLTKFIKLKPPVFLGSKGARMRMSSFKISMSGCINWV